MIHGHRSHGKPPIIGIKSRDHLFGDVWHMSRRWPPKSPFNLHQSPERAIFLAYFVSSFQQKVSNRQVGKKLTERFTKSGRNFHVNILGANLGYSNNLYTMYSSNIFTNSDNAILPKTVENPDSSRNVSIFNFCKFALPPVVAHHHHSKLTLSLSAPSYYLGISKVILNNINLPHQRGKNYVVNYLAQKSGSTTHLGAKSCGHPWWCPPPGCTAVSDLLCWSQRWTRPCHGSQRWALISKLCCVANWQSLSITFWLAVGKSVHQEYSQALWTTGDMLDQT